ncbi:MAG: alpha-2-macroglobulin family protein [Pirellulaceae bacterium]
MRFTMPEALTEWKFLGFAHDQQLRSGLLTDTVVTAKDLMVQPNPPRFMREGIGWSSRLKSATNLPRDKPARCDCSLPTPEPATMLMPRWQMMIPTSRLISRLVSLFRWLGRSRCPTVRDS